MLNVSLPPINLTCRRLAHFSQCLLVVKSRCRLSGTSCRLSGTSCRLSAAPSHKKPRRRNFPAGVLLLKRQRHRYWDGFLSANALNTSYEGIYTQPTWGGAIYLVQEYTGHIHWGSPLRLGSLLPVRQVTLCHFKTF